MMAHAAIMSLNYHKRTATKTTKNSHFQHLNLDIHLHWYTVNICINLFASKNLIILAWVVLTQKTVAEKS